MNAIPHHLLEQIKAGNVVLFLGAGASFGCKNNSGDKIPSGQELSNMIASKFLGKDYLDKNLDYVSELAISESSLFEVQNFVAEIFKHFEPEKFHQEIPSFNWKAIFTTNYDLIIEKVYQKYRKPLQELKPVIKNTPVTQIFTSEKILPYYKIHGCINDINDPEAPLIMTPDQFVNYLSKRDRLFAVLKELSYDYPVLFVGFSMADYDIRTILNSLQQNLSARTRSYMVGPGITELEHKLWDLKKITGIKITFEEFLNKIITQIPENQRIFSFLKPNIDLPIYSKFKVQLDNLKPSENFLPFIQNDIDFIHPNLNAPNTDPKQFYKGYFENWDPIIKNLDINRKIKDGILYEVFMDDTAHSSDSQLFYLIQGNAGSGKSVLLKRLAFDAGITLERFCIFLKADVQIKIAQILELYSYVKERIYLFIDDIAKYDDDIVYFISKCRKEKIKITIIGCERTNVWNMECQALSNNLTESFLVKYLHDGEIRELLLQLEKHHALYTLETKTNEERIQAFEEKAGRELLVALYEATNSKSFEEIILDEYKSINDPRAQSLYLTVSIFHRLGAEARAGFISRVHNISFHEFKESLFKPLAFIVTDKKNNRINDYVYVTRNKLIAQIIFEKVLTTPQDRFDEYIRVLKNLNIDFDSDRTAFFAITNAKKLIEVFPDAAMIRKLYDEAEHVSNNDAKLLQQKAIFEMNSPGGSIELANRYLKEAYKILPEDPIISHSFGEMMYKKAERAKVSYEFYSCIDECINICSSIIQNKKFQIDSHPYHTILKALVLKLKYILETEDSPSIERTIKDIEKSFSNTKQVFPNEEFILEIESKFNEIINEKGNAKELLEKAFNTNKGSPFLALRLASFYEKENNITDSLQVIKSALGINAGDRDLNFKYGMLLEKNKTPNYDDIKYYLKRAFTHGDSRHFAQLWYARAMYITNQFNEANDIFKSFANVNMPPEIRSKPIGILRKNGKNSYFEGVITKVEISYGFIKRDGLGDSLFFYRYNNDYDWDKFSYGKRVSFEIGFNYKGPIAINVNLFL